MSAVLSGPRPKTIVSRPYSPEDLLAMPDGDRFELVDGQLVEKHMSQVSSWIAGRAFLHLTTFVDAAHLGWIFPADCTYQCFPNAASKVRRPDVSFIRLERLPEGRFSEGHTRIAPDLVVEVASTHDLVEEVELKIDEYLSAGVQSVWLISPAARAVTIYHADGSAKRFSDADELTEPELLPGFHCRVAELLPPVPAMTPPATESAGAI